jgi:hypothetical protein
MAAPASSSSPLIDTYAAGLIDGEGYLGISHVKAADTYTIRVQVAMVTKGSIVLSRMQRVYGGRITQRPPETDRNAEKDVWVLDGQQAFGLHRGDQASAAAQGGPSGLLLGSVALDLEEPAVEGEVSLGRPIAAPCSSLDAASPGGECQGASAGDTRAPSHRRRWQCIGGASGGSRRSRCSARSSSRGTSRPRGSWWRGGCTRPRRIPLRR